ncbi:hypothetical protein OROMI_018694 [Orobanche minor]
MSRSNQHTGYDPNQYEYIVKHEIHTRHQPIIISGRPKLKIWGNTIDTFDASRKENFQLRAALLWTISDLPGLANLSGWSTKGKYACPVCLRHTNSEYLKNSHKPCYMSHRIFLPSDHPFRNDTHSFDGNEERREAPSYPTSPEIFAEVKDFENKFGKLVGDQGFPYNWKERSIFYELPYWESNLLRHNLDLMHIEKAVCDKFAFTFLGSDKSKDNINAHLDLKDKGIRPELHPFVDENGKELPDRYDSNISKNVQLKPPKIFISKSHDNHILMQQLLPIALRNLLPDYVRATVLRLCKYFRELCSKTLNHLDLVRMEGDIAVTLCQLEKIFPPSFFDLTVHVTIHLVTEAKLGGLVYYRWMYLCTLKSYVHNKGRPEGSIAEGYLAEECLSFVSQYLDENVETRQNRTGRNEDQDFMINEDEHEPIIRRTKRRSQEHDIRQTHSQEFSLWFCCRRHDEPFVLASQVQQVFYVHDPSDKDWHVVIRTKARHNVEDGSDLIPTEIDAMLQSTPCNEMSKKTISTNSLLQMVKKQRNSFAKTVHTKAQLSSDDDYQGDRNMADPVNAQPNHHRVGTNQQSAYPGPTNKHVSLGTHQQMSDNINDAVQNWIDDEVQDWNAFPEENYVVAPRITRRQRIMNNNQRKQSALVDEQMPPGNFNDAPDVEHDLRDDLFEKSRARGYTYMPHVWAISSKDSNLKRLPIEFNKYGKPIGPNKSRFVEFLGTITTYIVPPGYGKLVKQALGRSWKAFKCRIKTAYFDEKLTMEQNLRRRPDMFDERVKDDHWKFLVEHWRKDKIKEMSKKNRAMKKMQHITGKRSFAQVFEMEIAKKSLKGSDIFEQCYSRDGNTSNPVVANALVKIQLAPGEKDEGPNDIFSQVLGNDKGGRVRMLMRNADLRGHPDIVDISSMSPARNSQLEKSGKPSSHVHFFPQENNYAPTKSAQTLDPASCAHTKSAKTLDPTNSAQTLVPANCARTTVQSFEHDQSSAPTKLFRPPSFAKFTPPTAPLQSTKCYFSSIADRSKILLRSLLNNDYVANGVIVSLSPSKLVGNEELGAAWCEVKATVGIKLDEKLIRTIGSVKKIGQVIGRSVAWPKHLG